MHWWIVHIRSIICILKKIGFIFVSCYCMFWSGVVSLKIVLLHFWHVCRFLAETQNGCVLYISVCGVFSQMTVSLTYLFLESNNVCVAKWCGHIVQYQEHASLPQAQTHTHTPHTHHTHTTHTHTHTHTHTPHTGGRKRREGSEWENDTRLKFISLKIHSTEAYYKM